MITYINELTKNPLITKRAFEIREESEREENRQVEMGRCLVDKALSFDESIIAAHEELYID